MYLRISVSGDCDFLVYSIMLYINIDKKKIKSNSSMKRIVENENSITQVNKKSFN